MKTKKLSAIPAVRQNDFATGEVRVYWLGQAGFLMETQHVRLVIDPYLSDTLAIKYKGTRFDHARMIEVPISPADLHDIDYVLVTHGHTDHLDPGTLPGLSAANPNCTFIIPASCRGLAIERGVPAKRLAPVDTDETRVLDDAASLRAVPAAHEKRERDEFGHERYLGFIITLEGWVLYHSGDCIPYDGHIDELLKEQIDVCLLPVNGRDKERETNGVPGNFTLAEATNLADIVGARWMIGHHYGMFAFNTIDPTDARTWIRSTYPESLDRFLLAELGTEYIIR